MQNWKWGAALLAVVASAPAGAQTVLDNFNIGISNWIRNGGNTDNLRFASGQGINGTGGGSFITTGGEEPPIYFHRPNNVVTRTNRGNVYAMFIRYTNPNAETTFPAIGAGGAVVNNEVFDGIWAVVNNRDRSLRLVRGRGNPFSDVLAQVTYPTQMQSGIWYRLGVAWRSDNQMAAEIRNLNGSLFATTNFVVANPVANGGLAITARNDDPGNGIVYVDDLTMDPLLVRTLATSFIATRGMVESGGLAQLQTSDDQYVVIRNGPTALPTESPITVETASTSQFNSLLNIRFQNEVRSSILGLAYRFDLFDFIANTWSAADTLNAPSRTVDTIFVVNGTNSNRYLRPSDRRIQGRIRVRADAPVFTNTWRLFIDESVFFVN